MFCSCTYLCELQAFNWLGHLAGRGVGLFDEPASGLKTSSDQIMDQSFMSMDRHTPTIPRQVQSPFL